MIDNRTTKLLFILLLSCVGFNGFSQKCFKPDPFKSFKPNTLKYGLLGKVKSAEEFNYQQFVPDSLLQSYVSKNDLYFDSLGRLVREVVRLERGRFLSDYRYSYNNKNHYTEWVFYDSAGVPALKYSFQLNYQKPSVIKTVTYFSNNQRVVDETIYDKFGNMILLRTVSPSPKVYERKKYVYNKNGLAVKCMNFDYSGKILRNYENLIYDSTENVCRISKFSAEGIFMYDNVRKYDNQCRLIYTEFNGTTVSNLYDDYQNIVKVRHMLGGIIKNLYSYKVDYKYDEHGNWIVKTVFSLDEVKLTSVQRKIEYY